MMQPIRVSQTSPSSRSSDSSSLASSRCRIGIIAKQCVDDESAVILDICIERKLSYIPSVRDEGGTNSPTDCGDE